MRVMWAVSSLALSSCVTASVGPRFEQQVATTFAQEPMRKLETPELELFYPAPYEAAAKRVAARAVECVRAMRARAVTPTPSPRVLLFLTSANYNNAYVTGQNGGEPLHSLNPLSVTDEVFHFYGLGAAAAGDIACHEMFHAIHFEQTHGFWSVVNQVFGPVFPPQTFLERWFTEGAAQYFEGRIGRPVGRPHSPFYRGSFDSFVAMRGGKLEPGDLQIGQRELSPFSGAYLTGLHFIEWLVDTYGEETMWRVIDRQAHDVFSPLAVTLRFKDEYGLSLGALIEQWSGSLQRALVPRARPASETVVFPNVGQQVRLAVHAGTGVTAIVSSGVEHVPMLRILEADGRVRVERKLLTLTPDRDYVFAGPGSMSGLSFTADGQFLFVLNDDLIDRGDTRATVWKVDANTGALLHIYDGLGRGLSGSVSPDGARFTYVEVPPGEARIVERVLATGQNTTLVEAPPGVSLGAPSWNPSRTALAYSRLDPNGWNLVLHRDGREVALTTDGAFNYGARWEDDTHLVFMRTSGKYAQVHRLDLATPERIERLSDAPYGVLDPSPSVNGVRFAARAGVQWSIDQVTGAAQETLALTSSELPAMNVTPLEVTAEGAASPVDHLFLPQLRIPNFSFATALDPTAPLGVSVDFGIGLSLMGRDRLGFHTWAANGVLFVPSLDTNSVELAYRNLQLAPWGLVALASRTQVPGRVDWFAGVFAEREVFTVPVSFGVQALLSQRFQPEPERYLGPTFSMTYAAVESTAYAGVQRALVFGLDLSAYPRFLGSDRDLLDVRPRVQVGLPLPFSKRHSFLATAVGRVLPGAETGALQVGGVASAFSLLQSPAASRFPSAPRVFQPGSLVELVRGFDDYAFRARHAAVLSARYRYSFIVDRGTASILYVLPSFFFRQIDLEAFASGAVSDTQNVSAAGAAIFFRASLMGVLPLTLSYQFAWRFDAGLPPLHLLSFALE